MPDAVVTLTHELTLVRHVSETNSEGVFTFPNVLPGTYSVSVEAKGFKRLDKKGVVLNAAQKVSVGTLTMQVGNVTESVTVVAETTQVQTVSQERSAVVDERQMAYLSTVGRDFMNLLKVLPGTTYPDNQGAQQLADSLQAPIMSGIRGEYTSINLNGVIANTRSYAATEAPVNLDAVAEVQVMQSNFSAEFGRTAGAVINVVSKGGTAAYHGTGYWYKRNEALNANEFFNNRNGVPRAKYRYDTVGWNLGGPISFGGFNKDKNQLFFFFSQEIQPNTRPGGLRTYTVPTDLERQGNFSQSLQPNGSLYIVNDPTTGQPFPGNVIPQNRLNANGQRLLNVFPLPNFTNRAVSNGNYNLLLNDSVDTPIHQEILRVDYNPSPKWRIFVNKMWHHFESTGLATIANANAWGINQSYNTINPHLTVNVSYLHSPTLVNELSLGYSGWYEKQTISDSEMAKLQKDKLGITFGNWYQGPNPNNLIPAMTFGGIPGAASVNYDGRFPMDCYVKSYSISDSLTKVIGRHTLKAGLYTEPYGIYFQAIFNGWGRLAFDRNANWPFDTNYPYASAVLGNFQTYSEPSNTVFFQPINKVMEWFVQDNFKVNRRLTLDYGMRFTYDIPQYQKGDLGGTFDPALYDAAKLPVLYRPALNASGQRVAQDPITGQLFPQAYVGLFVPNSGDPGVAAVREGTPGYPRGFVNSNGVLFAPRFGFAYDPFGDGKTAIRAGAGFYYNARPQSGQAGSSAGNPPVVYTPTMYYGDLDNLVGSSGLLGPPNFSSVLERNGRIPTVYQMSFGVQRDIGFGTMIDVAYVGNMGRWLGGQREINGLPYGKRFTPSSIDPTTGRALPDNFLRPYLGYGSIQYFDFALNSSYHSLQTQVKHTFSRGLQFNVAWTWSKAMNYGDNYNSQYAAFNSPKVWNYGPASFDRTHTVVSNFIYDLPKVSNIWQNGFAKWVLDDWQTSGIIAFVSGSPRGIGMTLNDGADLSGGGDGVTPLLTHAAILPKSERTFTRYFDTSAIARPPAGSLGSGAAVSRYAFRGPGINNWDLSFFKNFRIKERATVQLRWEMYNAFNHTQFNGVNASAIFDAQGNQVNTQFGQITSARNARTQQGALRFSF